MNTSKFRSDFPTRIIYAAGLPKFHNSGVLIDTFAMFGEVQLLFHVRKARMAFVYYYDIRAAERALFSLRSKNNFGKKFKVVFSHPKIIVNYNYNTAHDINCGVVLVNSSPQRSLEEIEYCFSEFGEIRNILLTYEGYRIEYYDIRSSERAFLLGSYGVTSEDYNHVTYLFTGVLDRGSHIDFNRAKKFLVYPIPQQPPSSYLISNQRSFGPIRPSFSLSNSLFKRGRSMIQY